MPMRGSASTALRARPLALLFALVLSLAVVVAAAPATTAAPAFDVTSSSSYPDSSGNLVVVGEVRNSGDRTARFVRADVTFSDGSGRVLGTTTTYTSLDFLGPGERGSFRTSGSTPPGTSAYAITVSGSQADRRPTRLDAAVTNRFTDAAGYEHFAGTLTNRNTYDTRFSEADFTFYDAAGKVVDGDFTFSSGGDATVPAGRTGAFELIRLTGRPQFASLAVVGEGTPPSGYVEPNPEDAAPRPPTPPTPPTAPARSFSAAVVKADSAVVRRTGQIGVTTRNLLPGRVVKVFEERASGGRFTSTNKGQAVVNKFGTTRFTFRPTATAGSARIVVVGADQRGKAVRSSFTITVT